MELPKRRADFPVSAGGSGRSAFLARMFFGCSEYRVSRLVVASIALSNCSVLKIPAPHAAGRKFSGFAAIDSLSDVYISVPAIDRRCWETEPRFVEPP